MATRNINRPPRGDSFRRNGAINLLGLVKPLSTPAMQVHVNPILIPCHGKDWIDFVGGVSPEFTPPSLGYAKWDLVGLNKNGVVEIIVGEEAANDPLFPIPHKNFIPLSAVFIEGNDTEITEDMVFDIRPFLSLGSLPIDHSDLLGTSSSNLHEISSIVGLDDSLQERVTYNNLINLLKTKADIDGTPSTSFELNRDETGVPATTVGFNVNRGDLPKVGFRWNEQKDKWEYTNNGVSWIEFSNAGFISAANESNLGTVFLSVNPVDPQNPIAVGTNDPRLLPASDSKPGLVTMSTDDSSVAVSTTDERMHNARNPLSHSSSHVSGSDVIPNATTATNGLMAAGQVERLNEVTDDRLFDNLPQKTSTLDHLQNLSDPHETNKQHLEAIDHSLIFKNIQTQYIVGNDPSKDAFTSIQSAIDAAVANGDTINSKQAVIVVKPGAYVEDIVLQPNVILTSITGDRHYMTNINGRISMSFNVPFCSASICGFNMVNPHATEPLFYFSGSEKQKLHIYNCTLNSPSTSTLKADNTALGSTIWAKGTHFGNDTLSHFAVDVSGNTKFIVKTSGILNQKGNGVKVSGNGDISIELGSVDGCFTTLDQSKLTAQGVMINSGNKPNVVNSTAPTAFFSVVINSTTPVAVSGFGMFVYTMVAFLGSAVNFEGTLNANAGAHEIPSTFNSMYSTYKPSVPASWAGEPPANVKQAIDRLANWLASHSNGSIP